MSKSIKKVITLCLILCLTVSSSITALAGEWKQNENGWQYQNDDGSYVVNDWQLIDNKWYHFDGDGYMEAGGVLELDGKFYILMPSGALETNRDYGFGSSDENGVFTLKNFFTLEQEENVYATYCKQFGIDMNELFNGLGKNREYTIYCPNVNFPKDSEGGVQSYLVVEAIKEAINFNVWYAGVHGYPYSYHYEYDRAANSFTMSFKISDNAPTSAPSIIMY